MTQWKGYKITSIHKNYNKKSLTLYYYLEGGKKILIQKKTPKPHQTSLIKLYFITIKGTSQLDRE